MNNTALKENLWEHTTIEKGTAILEAILTPRLSEATLVQTLFMNISS